MTEEEIHTIYLDMPCRLHSYVMAKEGVYTIVLNSKLSHEMLLEAYQHELGHIKRGDYDKTCSADLIEIRAHEEIANHETKTI